MLQQKLTYPEFILSEHLCRTSLYEYAKQVWPLIEGVPFVDNWHIQAICEHLEALTKGDIRKLIINCAPRTMKSLLVMVIWQTWVWITSPETQFLMVSNGDALVKKAATESLNILLSEFYKKRWSRVFHLSHRQKEKKFFVNSKHGYRASTTTKATVIGRGGQFVVGDDFNTPYESQSEEQYIINYFNAVLSNRINDPKTSGLLIMQQRTGTNDLTSHLLKQLGWTHFFVPMEYDKNRPCKTIVLPSTAPNVWEDPRTQEGELMWPARFDEKYLKVMKAAVGSHIYSGQYQQSPRDEEGGLILRPWWKIWKETYRPKISYTIQSWDTALTEGQDADFSACTTWGIFDWEGIPNLILLSAWQGRVRGPELLRRAIRLKNNYLDTGDEKKEANAKYSPDIVIIEEKAAGHGLVSDLIERGIPAHGFNPGRYDKVARVNRASPYIECGFVWVAAVPPSFDTLRKDAEMVVDSCSMFPNGEHDDLVDTVSQAILYLKEKGILRHIEEIMYFKDEVDDANLPGFKKEGEKEFIELAEKRELTEKDGKRILADPFDYITNINIEREAEREKERQRLKEDKG